MKADFAFIDGGHRFDEIFLDFYYADLLLEQPVDGGPRHGHGAVVPFDHELVALSGAQEGEVRERLGRSFAKATVARGVRGEVELARIDHLQVRGGTVHHAGKRLHALLLNLVPARPDLYRCFKAGRLAIFNGPLEPMLSTKRNLALLSEQGLDSEDGLLILRREVAAEGRNRACVYDAAMSADLLRRKQLEHDLRIAVVHCLLLAYVPAAWLYLRARSRRTLRDLRPALSCDDARFTQMHASAGTIPPTRLSLESEAPKIAATIATEPTAAARHVLKNQRNRPPPRASAPPGETRRPCAAISLPAFRPPAAPRRACPC